MKSATATTEMEEPVTSPSVSTAAKLQSQDYILLLNRTAFICVYAVIRLQWNSEDENQPALENNGGFKITGIAALSGLAVAAGILWCMLVGLHWFMRDVYYTLLKLVGSFSEFLVPFSLMVVLLLPPKINWIGFLVVCAMFGIIVACFYLADQQQNKRSSTFSERLLVLVCLLYLSVLCIPKNLNRIRYPLIHVSLRMEIGYHFITYLIFINQLKNKKPSNLEAHKVDPTRQEQHSSLK